MQCGTVSSGWRCYFLHLAKGERRYWLSGKMFCTVPKRIIQYDMCKMNAYKNAVGLLQRRLFSVLKISCFQQLCSELRLKLVR